MKREQFRQSKDTYQLMERRPAGCFEEAYPIGNGSQGAMIYGGTDKECISLNDDTLWTGYPYEKRFRGDHQASLARAKEAVLQGDLAGATREIDANFSGYASAAYLPLGDLCITYATGTGKVSGYRRVLDLKRAVVSARYQRGGVTYTVTAFASHPDKAIIYRIEAQDASGAPAPAISLSAGFRSQLYARAYTENGLLYLDGECPVTSEQTTWYTERKTQYYDEPERRGVRFMAIAEILTDGGRFDQLNTWQISGATYCEFRISMASSFAGYEKHPFTEGRDYRTICSKMQAALSQKPYVALLRAHVRDHARYFNRVKLDLGGKHKSGLPTSTRMRRFGAGEEDNALPALLFNFGRYLTIAGSRPGSQPLNLQGIWNDKYAAPWHGNYTLNINLEMNYFPTLAVALPEMYQPLLRLIEDVANTGRETARVMYGADGWCCHHNTDLWRFTQPVCGLTNYSFWNLAGGWLCHHLTEYYDYTLDKSFLEKTAYPIMREAIRFYLSQLVTMDGYRILFPATSPENFYEYKGEPTPLSETTEMSMAILRELFSNYLRVCDILGCEDELTATVKEELAHLLPTRIGKDGCVMEWYRDLPELEVQHRHLSHLYALYPAQTLRPENDPTLCEAYRRSLEKKGRKTVGWSLAWRASLYAMLGDGEAAYSFVRDQLNVVTETGISYTGGGGSYTNLFGACPPFQIDSNFGITAAIAEMLLQSDSDTLHLMPALPAAWGNVRLTGLRAKGNRQVSYTACNGSLASCTIHGSMPTRILVAGRDMTDRFVTDKNGNITFLG